MRFAMGTGNYLFLLLAYAGLGSAHIFYRDVANEEDDSYKYVAQDDIEDFKSKLDIFGEEYGKTWMVLPNDDNVSYLALLDDGTGSRFFFSKLKYTREEISDYVRLKSYNTEYPGGKDMEPGDINTLLFDSSKPTKFICHGWMADGESSVIVNIRDAYLENQDVNIIGVDWSYLSKDYRYWRSARDTKPVGEYLAHIIDSLVQQRGAKYNDFHLIGHSLGAHIFGYAGSYTQQKVGRITGLDPALPLFQTFTSNKDRLDSSDANFVDIIHTCAGILGMSKKLGHIDFFPNGGSPYQPGCKLGILPTTTQACSHGRSHQLFAESIRHSKFKAVGCSDWSHFKKNNCDDDYAYMGEYTSPRKRGAFYLKTGPQSPFALGHEGTFFS